MRGKKGRFVDGKQKDSAKGRRGADARVLNVENNKSEPIRAANPFTVNHDEL